MWPTRRPFPIPLIHAYDFEHDNSYMLMDEVLGKFIRPALNLGRARAIHLRPNCGSYFGIEKVDSADAGKTSRECTPNGFLIHSS